MARQQHYDQKIVARGGGAMPAPKVAAPQVDDSAAQLFRHLDDFLKTAGPALGRAYVAQETGKVDDLLLAANQKFDEWKAAYQQASQGALAANASRDYMDAFRKIAAETEKEMRAGDHTVFPDLLKRRLAERAAYAARDGLQYQMRQTELWQHSQWESQLDEFQRFVAANPEDTAAVQVEADALKGSWQSKNPGKDSGKVFNQIDETANAARMEAMLARGDDMGAEALLNEPKARQLRGPKPGSVSERNLAAYNFGNVRSTRGGFAAYASRHDGLMAVAERFLRYSNAPERGWHARTLREAMEIYAPRSENNTDAYVKTLAQKMGVDPDAEIDFRDPHILKLFVKHVPAYEHGSFLRIDDAEAERAARAVAEGGRPRETGLAQSSGRGQGGALDQINASFSPGARARYEGRIKAIRAERAARERAAMKDSLDNYMAALNAGELIDAPYDDDEIAKAFGDDAPRLMTGLAAARQYAADMTAAKSMTAREMNELLAFRKPVPGSPDFRERSQAYGRLASGFAQLQKAMAEDPAAYALAAMPEAAKARAEFFAQMTPESGRALVNAMRAATEALELEEAILPKADAQALAEIVTRAPEPVKMLSHLGACFGRAYPQVMRSLSPSLSPTLRVLAGGVPDEAGRLILQAARDKDFDKRANALLFAGGTRKDFDEALDDRISEYAETFMAGADGETPMALRDAIGKLAIQYMGRLALKESDALDRAVKEVVGDRYEIVKQGGWFRPNARSLRIPKGYDASAISTGMDSWLNNIDAENLLTEEIPGLSPEAAAEAVRSMLRRGAYWITADDESGAILFLGTRAVRRKNGDPVRFTWEEFASRKWEADAAAEEAAQYNIHDLAAGIGIEETVSAAAMQ